MDTRVVVTKFLGVHLDFQLNWSKHLSGITNKIANHVSVMYRVRPFTVQIVHSFCRQACLPYLNYCCEAWGNTYKNRIQPLYILSRTRQLGFVENEDYRSHTRSLFYQWKTFGIYDIVNNSMVFNVLSVCQSFAIQSVVIFLKVNDSHNHNTVTRVSTKNNNTLKIRFSRTTQKAALCKRAKHVKYSEHWCKIVQSYCSIQEKI